MNLQGWGDDRFMGRLGPLCVSLIVSALGVILLLSVLRPTVVVSAPEENMTASSGCIASVSTASCTTCPVHITKTVDPTYLYTTGTVSTICFTIKRPGLDVVLAQDVSNSMEEPAGEGATPTCLEASQLAASAFVNSLQSTDRAAVVPFSTLAYVALPLTATKSSIIRTIYDLTLTDKTNIGEGISVTHRELIASPRYVSGTVKAIILLSDGRANRPIGEETARAYTRARAEAAANDDIKIYTIGFGGYADEELLQEIADIGRGEYFFAPDEDVLNTIYLTIALELHSLVITDILLPGVEANCSQWPEGLCVKEPGGVTTVTFPISDSSLISNPLSLCFTATVELPPCYEGPINDSNSGACYHDASDRMVCREFNNPTISVAGLCSAVYLPVVAENCPPTNGGFEDGWIGWEHGGKLSQTITSANPHSGNYSVLLGDPNYRCTTGVPIGSASITQTVLVPSVGYSRLSFWYNIFTYDKNVNHSDMFDLFDVKINRVVLLRDMNTQEPFQCTNPVWNLGWRHATIDLSSYRGRYITITFENWNRFQKKYNTWTYVDDVEICP